MTEQALDTFLKQEIAAFPCKTAVLVGEVESGKVLWALEPDTQVVSASTIKVPVLLAALEEVRQGAFPGENILFLHSGGAGGLFAVELPE